MPNDFVNPVILPKRVSKGKSVAQTKATATKKGEDIATDFTTVLNRSITDLRSTSDLSEAIRSLSDYDPTLSAAIFDFVEIANTPFAVTAYDPTTHEVDVEGTMAARSVIAQLDTLYDYSLGFSDKLSFQSLIETSLLEVITSGALANELVLNKAQLPERINVISYDTLRWKSGGDGTKYPVQTSQSGGDDVDLNLATFYVTEMHKYSARAYAQSMMSASLNTVFHFGEFLEEMRASVRRSGHVRITAQLITEKIAPLMPAEIRDDPKKSATWLNEIRSGVEKQLQDLNPDDALVAFDSVDFNMLKAEGEKSDYVPLMNALSGQLATALKTSPSILGLRINGSQSLSNTESLVFLKVANAIRRPLETNFSRALTLAVRLNGSESYVKFKFSPINLRPEDELEAFKVMRQDRIYKLLSEGFISDDEAAIELGTFPRPAGAPPLMGTGFARDGGIDAEKASPNADPQGKALQAGTPKKGGGKSQ